MDKEKAIITQVAAKIAAELVSKEKTTDEKIGEFALLFTSVKDVIFEAVGVQSSTDAEIYSLAKESFNATPVEATSGASVQIVGQQHGDLPNWLITACKRDGVTKVYDNRDGLSVNPKRPWFKAVDADKAYWAPKTRSSR